MRVITTSYTLFRVCFSSPFSTIGDKHRIHHFESVHETYAAICSSSLPDESNLSLAYGMLLTIIFSHFNVFVYSLTTRNLVPSLPHQQNSCSWISQMPPRLSLSPLSPLVLSCSWSRSSPLPSLPMISLTITALSTKVVYSSQFRPHFLSRSTILSFHFWPTLLWTNWASLHP